MALTITYQIRNEARPLLLRLGQSVQRPEIKAAMGGAVAREQRKHFRHLDETRPNRMGGRRTHFWGAAVKAVRDARVVPEGVQVTIDSAPVALHFFGGVVTPGKSVNPDTGRPTRFLAIPARSEEHGRLPGEYDDLEPVFGEHGGALVRRWQTRISVGRRRKDGSRTVSNQGERGGEVLFWLTLRAVIKGDKSVLAPEGQVAHAALLAGEEHLQTMIGRGLA